MIICMYYPEDDADSPRVSCPKCKIQTTPMTSFLVIIYIFFGKYCIRHIQKVSGLLFVRHIWYIISNLFTQLSIVKANGKINEK